MAKTGLFNIAIASRSEEKLNAVRDQIKSIDNSLEVKVIPVNLAECSNERYRQVIDVDLKDVELNLVINNAGKANRNPFFQADPAVLDWMIRLNIYAYTFLTVSANRRFLKQNKEIEGDSLSGFIQLSSIVGNAPFCFNRGSLAMYCATKRFNLIFAQQYLQACKQRSSIDTLIVQPGRVTTQMTGYSKARDSCLPEMTSFGSLAALGKTDRSGGAFVHSFLNLVSTSVPGAYIHYDRIKKGN